MRACLLHRWRILVASVLAVVIAIGVVVGVGLTRSTPQSVKEIASLAQVLKTKDPVLRQPTQRIQFDQLAASLEATARSDPGAPYWLAWEWLNKLALFAKSPHTEVYFFLDSPEVYPLAFTWAANGLAVSSFPAGRSSFPAYSQVVKLGNITPEKMLVHLKSVMAGNSYWVRQLGQFYLSFPYLLHWTGALNSGDALRMTVKEPSGRVKTVTVQPSLVAHPGSVLQWLVKQPGKSDHPTSVVQWLASEVPDFDHYPPAWYVDPSHGYGVFHIYTMSLSQTLTSDLRDFFTTVEKDDLHRVLFDVRGNAGGNDCVTNAVLAYLPDPSAVSVSGCGAVSPAAPNSVFHGKVFVAQDWGTASAAVVFSAALSQLPGVTVVGTPAGGSPSGDFGNVMMFKIKTADSFPVLIGQVGTQQACFSWPLPTSSSQPSPLQGGCPLFATFNPKVLIPMTVTDLRDHIDPVIQWLNSQP